MAKKSGRNKTGSSHKKARSPETSLTRERWHWDASPHRQIAGISGAVADGISYAIDWRFKITADKPALQSDKSLLSESGCPLVKIHGELIIILEEGWGHHPPRWLVDKVYEYCRSREIRTNRRTVCIIKRILRRSHSRHTRGKMRATAAA